MSDPEDDPWNTPDLHRNHIHAEAPSASNGNRDEPGVSSFGGNGYGPGDDRDVQQRTTSTFTTPSIGSETPIPSGRQSAASGVMTSNPGDWGYFDGSNPTADAGFGSAPSNQAISPFGGAPSADRTPNINPPAVSHTRTISAGRTGSSVEENIVVTLMPEKEGLFMFQHHNYEVTSSRRGSKVIRRYSDFVWLLDCLHKRYPFRVLPLLPPKRVAVNGNHLSNDGAFIEKRRRGLSRFLNAVVRHPVLGQEQLVIMFLTVPTVRLLLMHISFCRTPWLIMTTYTGAFCMAQAGNYLGARRVHRAAVTPRSRRLFAHWASERAVRSNAIWSPPVRRAVY